MMLEIFSHIYQIHDVRVTYLLVGAAFHSPNVTSINTSQNSHQKLIFFKREKKKHLKKILYYFFALLFF